MIRLLIAEDSRTVQRVLQHLLVDEPNIEFVGIANDGEEAVRLYQARLNMEGRLADAGSFSPRSSFSAWRRGGNG